MAGSLGGARPKASIEGDGCLWIAKFTSNDDRRAVERAEVATLKLARGCGLAVPEARLELAKSSKPVDARQSARKMASLIKRQWKVALRAEGASRADVRDYAPAFEHEEIDKACLLKS